MVGIAETFIFGIANGLHCAGMCGPLAACATGGSGVLAYHLARVMAYATVGMLLGTAGGSVAGLHAPTWIPFLLGGSLLLMAAGRPQHLAMTSLGRAVQNLLRGTLRWPTAARAAALGAVTPLLPCGLLWAVFGSAIVSGGPVQGTATMAAFALGTLPAVAFAGVPLAWLRRNTGAETAARVQRAVLVVAAAVLIGRGIVAASGSSCCG